MQHLLIGTSIFTLIAGITSAYSMHTKYVQYRYPFFKTYKNHILIFNLYLLSLSATKYIKTNILDSVQGGESIAMRHAADALFLFQKFAEYFVVIAVAYTLIRFLYQILNKRMGNPVRYYFLSVVILSSFAYGMGLSQFLTSGRNWLDPFCDVLSGLVFIPTIWILAFTGIKMKDTQKENREFPLRIFLLFYIAILSFLFLQNYVSFQYKNVFVVLAILSVNPFSIFWTKQTLRTANPNPFSLKIDARDMERIVSDYQLSNREREIFEHILRGCSNREIQNKLFLSAHTVKNHNYNLYKKLGIRNRSELFKKVYEVNRERMG